MSRRRRRLLDTLAVAVALVGLAVSVGTAAIWATSFVESTEVQMEADQ